MSFWRIQKCIFRCIFLIIFMVLTTVYISGCQNSSLEEVNFEVITLEDGTELFRYSNMEHYAIQNLQNCTSDVYITPNTEVNGYPVKEMWEKATVGNTSIKTMIVTDNIEEIAFDVFYYEFSSLESIFLGAGTKKVQYGMFARCPNLKQVTVDIRNPIYYSENNAIIERDTHRIVAASNATRDIPTTAKILAGDSFTDLNLEDLMLPDNIEKIEARAFRDCAKLLAVYIPESIQAVGEKLFVLNNTQSPAELIVFCETKEKPIGWDDNWDDGRDIIVHWGATAEDYRAHLNSIGLISEASA